MFLRHIRYYKKKGVNVDDFERLKNYLEDWRNIQDIKDKFNISETLCYRRLRQIQRYYGLIRKRLTTNKKGYRKVYKVRNE